MKQYEPVYIMCKNEVEKAILARFKTLFFR